MPVLLQKINVFVVKAACVDTQILNNDTLTSSSFKIEFSTVFQNHCSIKIVLCNRFAAEVLNAIFSKKENCLP